MNTLLQEIENQGNYQIAMAGGFGHNVLVTGETSVADRLYFCVYANEDSVISYENGLKNTNNGDATVTSLSIEKTETVVLGVVKNINVVSGKVMGHLISVTK